MATTTQTTTATATELELTPPDPVPMVVPEKASGLVAIDTEKKSALETKVEGFLAELRRTVEDLDPGRKGKLTGRKFLGIIPFGNSLKSYFDSYTSAQGHISAILARLASGKDELLMDNATIDVERVKLWEAMGKLEQMVHIAKTLDDRLEEEAANLDHTDPAKAKAIRETALFYVRQRTQDLLTQMAVTVQGYLA